MSRFEFRLGTGKRPELFGQGWAPDNDSRAVVCLVHGLGEHSGRYGSFAALLNQEGFAVVAFDLRGHGRSGGRRGHVRGLGLLIDDIDALVEQAKSRFPGLPIFTYGHSLGGTLAIAHAYRTKEALAGVVASAPLFRPVQPIPFWKTAAIQALTVLRVEIPLANGIDPAALSRDPNVVRLYQSDPLVHDRIGPALAAGMLRQGEWNLKHAERFPLPILLMHGEADRITSVEASVEFAARVEHRGTLEIWNGLQHELHNEPEKETVIAYAAAWMRERIR